MMDFGQALQQLKAGETISRDGWNGKGMFLYLVGEGRYPAATPAGQRIAHDQPDGLVPYRPYIAMKTAQGDVVPWVASQSDILATDWQVGANADEEIKIGGSCGAFEESGEYPPSLMDVQDVTFSSPTDRPGVEL